MVFLSEAPDTLKLTVDQLQSLGDEIAAKGLYTFNEHFGVLTSGSLLSVLFYMLMMVGLAFFFYHKKKALDFCDRYLTYAFVVVWMLGFVVYDLGMYPDHSTNAANAFWALFGVAPMAVIHAFGMFFLQSDVSAIHDGCYNSAWYMFFFSISHFLAAFISMVFVIKHFGFNIVANFIRMIKTHFWLTNVKDLYVFWGMNDATYYLAKNIIDTNHNADARIMIVRVNNQKEDPNKLIGMDRLFSFLSLTNNNLENLQELQKLGCLTGSTFGSLTDIQAGNNNDLIRDELRLNSVARLMDRTSGTVHMFFLDKDESFNLQAVGNLKRDTTVNEFVTRGKIKFYCQARHNSVHRVIEDEQTHENIEVRVIDSSHLSVEMLKLEENIHLQPVSYVDIKDDAAVSSPFNALVVGFSEVGYDMVRFLYEFSAFVNANPKDADKIVRSDFHCDVVDKEMASLAGLFIANTPALVPRPQLHLKEEPITKSETDESPKPVIDFHEMDCQGMKFYNCLESWLPSLNYIVLATGNDELNMTNAELIFRLVIRRKDSLDRFRIMVRVRHDENGHFKQIAQYYNRLWKAELVDPENRIHQHVIASNENVDGPITLFGSAERIYTYDHIVNEALKENAKLYKEKYDQSNYDLQMAAYLDPDNPRTVMPDSIVTWNEEQNDLMQLIDDFRGYSPTYSGIMKLRRTQSQNVANSLHAATKALLALKAFTQEELTALRQHGIIRDVGKNQYRWKKENDNSLDHIQLVLDRLAQTEHLRWVASHEMHGYQISPDPTKKDEARLLHCHMCEWSELEDDVKSYDYNAVDVSLADFGFFEK